MTILSIDPGIRGCGAALWFNSKLIAATYVKSIEQHGSDPYACVAMAWAVNAWVKKVSSDYYDIVTQLVLEWPQTYGGRASKGDAADLFPLAGVDAALATIYSSANSIPYVPHQWKGSIGKPKNGETYIIESRVRDRLSEEELSKIVWPKAKKLTWDVSDAIGIGLHHLGRLERKRVIARQ